MSVKQYLRLLVTEEYVTRKYAQPPATSFLAVSLTFVHGLSHYQPKEKHVEHRS